MDSPKVEQMQARQCQHIERGELEAAALVRIESLPGHTYRNDPINFNTIACGLCTGRALGAMFAADCERPGNREAIDEISARLIRLFEAARFDTTHELALALIEVGWKWARQLGDRQHRGRPG